MQSKLILVAAAATGAMAVHDLSGSFPQNFRRAIDVDLVARDEAACTSAVAEHMTVTEDFPLVPTELASATDVDIPQITDPCVFPSITGSVGQVITSYSSALQSWQDAHITEIRSIWSACTDVPLVSEALDAFADQLCSTALAPLTASGTAVTTATATADVSVTETVTSGAAGATGTDAAAGADGAAASSTVVPAAAPRETGMMVAAAAAAAGVVGAVLL
ncbi:hypothetical protein CCHL11_00960 [Colletotrichum chlorophyti]|uniref:Infection structure specific protein n=1 Tax=Colletotrichum chlorophyti TaxID=708187 RepID=A0A1Q8S7P1_9PEZI|nr:hypothetical protein CCHL11_00960 [Colletotrichum chlorophyti]